MTVSTSSHQPRASAALDQDVADVLRRLGERRSCRAFDGSPMAPAEVDSIIRDGLQAPSSCNLQQWHFVVVSDPALKRRAQEIAGGNPHFLDCAVVIYLCFQKGWTHDKFSVVQSVAGACYHMMLSAHLRGYGSIWNAGIGDTSAIAAMLAIPPIFEIQGALCLGRARADAPALKPPRRALEAVRSWEKFQRPVVTIYPAKKARTYPYFAIRNAYNPYAQWNPALWGWDQLADFRGYAVWNKSPLPGVFASRRQVGAMALEVGALPDLLPGARLLEVLPWGGVYSTLLRRRFGPDVHLHMTELSDHNHAFIRERMRREGLSDAKLHAESCFDGRFSLADATIDAAFLPRVLECTPDRSQVLDELLRVMKPGATAVISARNAWSAEGWRYHRTVVRGQVPNSGPYRPIAAPILRRELSHRFNVIEEFGFAVGADGTVHRQTHWRRYCAPIYVARVVKN